MWSRLTLSMAGDDSSLDMRLPVGVPDTQLVVAPESPPLSAASSSHAAPQLETRASHARQVSAKLADVMSAMGIAGEPASPRFEHAASASSGMVAGEGEAACLSGSQSSSGSTDGSQVGAARALGGQPLPLADSALPPVPVFSVPAMLVPAPPAHRIVHVLIIDDERMNCKLVSRMLARLHCTFDILLDGADLPTYGVSASHDDLHAGGLRQRFRPLQAQRSEEDAHETKLTAPAVGARVGGEAGSDMQATACGNTAASTWETQAGLEATDVTIPRATGGGGESLAKSSVSSPGDFATGLAPSGASHFSSSHGSEAEKLMTTLPSLTPTSEHHGRSGTLPRANSEEEEGDMTAHRPQPVMTVILPPDAASAEARSDGGEQPGPLHSYLGADSAASQPLPYDKYQLILLDIVMPRSNGVFVAQHLRKKEYHGTLIAMTANRSLYDIALYRRSGFDGVLPKPFTFAAVQRIVEGVRAKMQASVAVTAPPVG
ncbi:response regulator [archaeon]|nr:MAG: response regulator [archaeon]